MKRLKSIIIAALAVLVGTAYVVPVQPAAAQSSGSPDSSSLSIAPKKNYVIEPGNSADDKLTIRNLDTAHDLQLTLRVIDFTFTDDGGTPKLFLDPNAEQTTWSLKPFLTIPKSVTIPKGGSKSVDMSVKIPAGQGAGSFYSAIIYSTGAPDGGNVGLSASGVTLVFTQIPGKVNEDLKLQKFGAYKTATPNDKPGYIFVTAREPQNVAYTLKNNGNVTEAPAGSITLKNNFFGQTYAIDNVNPSGSLALIGQTRTYTACIKLKAQDVDFSGTKTSTNTCVSPGLWPGMYTAKLDVFYGQNGNNTQEITSTAIFWYLPWWFVIIVLILLAAIIFGIWRLWVWVRVKLYGKTYKKQSRRSKK